MAAMTLQNMRDHVRNHMDLDVTDLPDAVVDQFLKEGYAIVVRREPRWPFFQGSWTYNTVAGTRDVPFTTIGADVDSVIQIMAPQWLLREMNRDVGDKLYPTNYVTAGQPTTWARWGSTPTLRLYPTPDGIYTLNIRGFQKADTTWFAVASGAGTPAQLPDDLHMALCQWGLYRAYLQQDDPLGASNQKDVFHEYLALMEEDFRSPRSQQPLVLGGGVRPSRFLPERLPYPFDF